MKFCARALTLVILFAALAACTPELDWRQVPVAEGGFSVLLPGKARRESRALNNPAGALTMTMYACSLKQGSMGVAYTDYPAASRDAEHAREKLDAARDALLRNIAGDARFEEDISIQGYPGRQVYAEGRAGSESVLLKARFVVVGSRLYQIVYVGGKDGIAMADVDMFLDSFKLLH